MSTDMATAGSVDTRPFAEVMMRPIFTVFANNFDPFESFGELSAVAGQPRGLAFSPDNATLYLSDVHTGNITACSYSLVGPDVSDCGTVYSVTAGRPGGLATDTAGHLWLTVAWEAGAGSLLEINPETGALISKIGQFTIRDRSLEVSDTGVFPPSCTILVLCCRNGG